MSRNLYDSSVTLWSPQGKIFQLEYADEATKHGSCCVGVKSKNNVVLATIRKSFSDLAELNSKANKINDNIGVMFCGITSDADHLINFMKDENSYFEYQYGSIAPVSYIIHKLSLLKHECTISDGNRPFGISFLIGACEENGTHLYETRPSGEYESYYAYAIGSRSQGSKTYLESVIDDFENSTEEQLIEHAIKALKKSIKESEIENEKSKIEVLLLSKDKPYQLISTQTAIEIFDKV